MPVTFGAVGDIISLSLLVKELVKCLDDSRGSSADYQAVIRELWSLDRALLEVELLCRSREHTPQLNALSVTTNECAKNCRKSINVFQRHVQKFKKTLSDGNPESLLTKAASKIQWQISEKEVLAKFRAEISAHCFSINMLLTTTGMWVFRHIDNCRNSLSANNGVRQHAHQIK